MLCCIGVLFLLYLGEVSGVYHFLCCLYKDLFEDLLYEDRDAMSGVLS